MSTDKSSPVAKNMPPLNDKVLSRMATILARDTSAGLVVAYVIAGVFGLIALVALLALIAKHS
jgi:hypothetical protein